MSFSVHKNGPRDEVAKDIREGDHHVQGDQTQWDYARKYVAEEIERAPTPEHQMNVSVSGHHSETFRSINIQITATEPLLCDVLPPIEADMKVKPGIHTAEEKGL